LDLKIVEPIARDLRTRIQDIWFDEWELIPGDPAQDMLEKAMEGSKAIVVFIGPNGTGRWQSSEVHAAYNELVQKKKRIIPVLLPSIKPNDDRIPLFLRSLVAVEFGETGGNEAQIERLVWAITDKNPIAQGTPGRGGDVKAKEATDYIDDAIDDLRASLGNDNITFFLGRNSPSAIPQCDISQDLLSQIDLFNPSDEAMLPPLDLAASYFAMEKSDVILEANVNRILRERAKSVPEVYDEMGELLKVLVGRPQKRGQRRHKQLIVSTSFDTLLEKALLLSGIAFTRLVQYRTDKWIEAFEYENVGRLADGSLSVKPKAGGPILISRGDRDTMLTQLDGILADKGFSIPIERSSDHGKDAEQIRQLSIGNFTEPIIYKLYGSQDLPNSAVLSRDQHFDHASSAEGKGIVPQQIEEIISNTPIVYLGCRIIDPDFLWSSMLLRMPLAARDSAFQKYMVHPKAVADRRDCGDKVEFRVWEKIRDLALKKYNIKMVDCGIEAFARRLREAIREP
jgi:hypothetical protein